MKRKSFFMIFILLGITSFLFAQQVPNGDFENWTGNTPDHWDTSNESIFGTQFQTVTIESDNVFSGDFAAQVITETRTVGFWPLQQSVTLPGILTLGEFILDTSEETAEIEGGIPFPYRPKALKGYFRANPAGGDTPMIGVGLSKWNAQENVRDTIGYGIMYFTETVNDWTEFEIVIDWESEEVPDSCNIIISSSLLIDNDDFVGGSTIWVDNLTFEYPAIIDVELFDAITVNYGTLFEELPLPEQIEVTLDDFSTKMLDILWFENDYPANGDEPGWHLITGEIILTEGITNPNAEFAELSVTILDEDAALEIVSVETFDPITVDYGTVFELVPFPSQIEVTLDDATTQMLDINWSDDSYPIDGDEPGDYTITGDIVLIAGITNPLAYLAEIDVTILDEVVDLEIVAVETFDPITVNYGTVFELVPFPSQIEVTLDDATTQMLDINWSDDSYPINGDEPGDYTITGDIVLIAGITNPLAYLAEIDVTILDEVVDLEIVAVETFDPITVDYGTVFELVPFPSQIEVTLDDATTQMLDINWSDDSYPINGDEPGDYTITGEIVLVAGITNPLAYLAEIDVTILDEDVAIDNISTSMFAVYPNPSSDIVFIEAMQLKSAKVIDLQGRILKEVIAGSEKIEMSLSNLSRGLYIIMIQTATEEFYTRIELQ